MNILVYTAMHKRQKTVSICLEYLLKVRENLLQYGITLDLIYGYTIKQDCQFLDQYPVFKYQAPNQPLWEKFHGGMDLLKSLNYDLVFMFGSDDIADTKYFLKCVELSKDYGHLAFKDIYFYNRKTGERWYWPGYSGRREGEPAGAGKVYTRKVMEAIDYKLFQPSVDRGLDRGCWEIMQQMKVKTKLLSVKDGYFLCDVKDGEGLTPTNRFFNLSFDNFDIPKY